MENNAPSSMSPEDRGDPVEPVSRPLCVSPVLALLTAEERARYEAHLKAGLSSTIALMLATKQAPQGRVKGSQFPTKDWDRSK